MWSDEKSKQGSYRFSKAQAEEALSRLRRLQSDGEIWKDAAVDVTKGAPRPLPELRLTPTY
jgi:hypothetical protein